MAGLFPSPALDFGIWGRNLDETLTTVKTGKSIHYFPCQHRYCFLLSTSSNKKVLGIVCMPHSSVMNQGGDGEWKPPLPVQAVRRTLSAEALQTVIKVHLQMWTKKPTPPHQGGPPGPGLPPCHPALALKSQSSLMAVIT